MNYLRVFIFYIILGISISNNFLLAIELPVEFKVEKFGKDHDFNFREVTSIAYDNAGVLWVVANGKVLSLVGNRFIQHPYTSDIYAKAVNRIELFVKDKQGNILFENENYVFKIKEDQKVYYYMDRSVEYPLNQMISHAKFANTIYRMGSHNYSWTLARLLSYQNKNGFYINNENLYFIKNGKTNLIKKYPKIYSCEVPFHDRQYFFTDKGIVCLWHNGKVKENVRILLNNDVPLLHDPGARVINQNNHLFLICKLGVFNLREKRGAFYASKLIDSSYTNNMVILDILESPNGNGFLLATSSGLYRLTKIPFSHLPSRNQKIGSINSIYPKGKELYLNNGSSIQITGENYNRQAGIDFVNYADDYEYLSKDKIAIKSFGLFHVSDQSLKNSQFTKNFISQSCLLKLKNNKTYLIHSEGVFEIFADGTLIRRRKFSNSKLFDWSFSAIEYKDSIYLATGSGVYKFTLDSKEENIEPVLNGVAVRFLQKGPRGEGLYAFTEGAGVYLFHNNKCTPMFIDEQDYLRNAHYIIADKFNRYWIPTNSGVFLFSSMDWIKSSIDDKHKPMFFYYPGAEPIEPTEFNGTSKHAWYKSPISGDIFLCAVDGLIVFNPSDFKSEFIPQKMVVHQSSFLGDKKDGLVNPPQLFETYTLLVSVPGFGNSQNLQMEYKLEGTHDQWHKIPDDGELVLNRVKTGTQTLILRYRYGLNELDYCYSYYNYLVIPFWYETKLFYVLLVILALTAVWYYTKFRQKSLVRKQAILEEVIQEKTKEIRSSLVKLEQSESKLKKTDEMKEKLIKVLAHDIRSPLISAYYVGNRMITLAEDNHKNEQSLMLSQVTQTIRSVYEYASDFLVWYNLQQGNQRPNRLMLDVGECLQQVLTFYQFVIENSGNFLEVKIEENVTVMNDAKALSIIFRNLIDNANKYSQKSLIKITMESKEEAVWFSFENTSPGLNPSIQKFMLERLGQEFDNKEASEGEWLGLRMVAFFSKITRVTVDLEFPDEKTVKFWVRIPYN